jgi:hypothetical protein
VGEGARSWKAVGAIHESPAKYTKRKRAIRESPLQ